MLKDFFENILKFKKNVRPEYEDQFKELAAGQSPKALVITCSDSRIVPDIILSANPGDFFFVRNVGNMVPCHTSDEDENTQAYAEQAALEFAVNYLGVKNIIIMGHSECGAMQACHAGTIDQSTPLGGWLKHGDKSLAAFKCVDDVLKADLPEKVHDQLSQVNVLKQLESVHTYPFVQEKIDKGELELHGWWFEIGNADVYAYNKENHSFKVVSEADLNNL